MGRRSHPKQEIETALKYAEQNGWHIEVGGAHAWGKLYCPYNDKACRGATFCVSSIWSTPKKTGNHAKQLRRVVDNCTGHHNQTDDPHEEEEQVMKDYDFTLKFSLQNLLSDPETYIEQLYEGGCEDALIGVGRKGYVSLNFTREAQPMKQFPVPSLTLKP